MFKIGRPKKHTQITFFTYETHDGMVLSYEMSNKGSFKKVDHQKSPRIFLKNQTRIVTDISQQEINSNENNEISLTEIPLSTLLDKLSMSNNNSNQDLCFQNINIESNYSEEQNISDMLNNDPSLENRSFDDDFFDCNTFLNSETKLDNTADNQYFGGLLDSPNAELKPVINDEDFFKF